jgi:hypothetical protein
MNEQESPLWILTFAVDTTDPKWELRNSIVGKPEQLSALFDLNKLPHGVRLLKSSKAVKRYIRQAVKEERQYYRERRFMEQAGERN